MRDERLGELEELLLLAVYALGEDTYGVPVQQYVERTTKRSVTMGAVYAALDRLERKGFVRSITGEATAVRGGKRKRHFSITAAGRQILREVRTQRERLWRAIGEGRS
jgi:DNA-binding PadR family transcriptional regulator